MTIEEAQVLIRGGHYESALKLLAALPDSNEIHSLRFQAASPDDRPEALIAAKQLVTQNLSVEAQITLFNWASQRNHQQLLVDVAKLQLPTRVSDYQFLLRVGQAAQAVNNHHLAFMCLHQALVVAESDIARSAVYSLLAATAKDYGQIGLAVLHFQQAYRLGRSEDELNNLIMAGQYAQTDLTQYYAQAAEYRRFSDVQRVAHSLSKLQVDRPAQGLRIGLISGDFTSHSLPPLLAEILGAIPQLSKHTLYFYQNRAEIPNDPVTISYKKMAAGWTNVTDMPADKVVLQMLTDELDVLIDPAGHTAATRLDVLARRPAPVQIGWVCGMMTPCAVESVPYFLADAGMITPHMRETCPEKLIELPSAYVYYPVNSIPLSAALPFDRRRAIQFGCLNNPCKVTPDVLDAWARILVALPTSHLHLRVMSLESGQWFQRELQSRGVGPRQLVVVLPQPSHLDIQRYYTETIDIALDTWPCAGMLTTLEAWWMGVPTVTLRGDTFLHNQSASVLKQLGASDLICGSIDQYVHRSIELASDLPRLRLIRQSCRQTMGASLIRQPRVVAQHVINGIEECWKDWCLSRHALAARLA